MTARMSSIPPHLVPAINLLFESLLASIDGSKKPGSVLRFDDARSEEISSLCSRERISPLLIHAVHERHIELSERVTSEVMAQVPELLTAMVVIEDAALVAVTTLEAQGIDVRVTKGLATAQLDYANPALRQFGDVDLLVPPAQFKEAVKVLGGAGMARKHPVRGNRWEAQHAIAIDVNGVELDLHHRLLHQAAGHLAARLDLFAGPEIFTVGGTSLRALPAPIRLLQAAAQNVLSVHSDRKLSSDADALLLAARPGVVEEAYRLALPARLTWLLGLGLGRLGVLDPDRVAYRNIQKDGRFERALRSTYADRRLSPAKRLALELAVAPPWAALLIAKSIALPGPEYLNARGRSRGDQARRQLARVGTGPAALWRRR